MLAKDIAESDVTGMLYKYFPLCALRHIMPITHTHRDLAAILFVGITLFVSKHGHRGPHQQMNKS